MRGSLDFSAKFLFNLVKIETIFVCDKINGQTEVSESAAAANAVKVRLGVLREVKVDDHIDRLDVDTASQEIRTYKVPADAVSEIMENTIPMSLQHLGMRIEARITLLSDLLR